MGKTIRRAWRRLALSAGLLAAALGAATAHAHPILAGIRLDNHCEPVVRDR